MLETQPNLELLLASKHSQLIIALIAASCNKLNIYENLVYYHLSLGKQHLALGYGESGYCIIEISHRRSILCITVNTVSSL